MKKIVMTPNPYRDRNFRYVKEAADVLEAAGVETKICLAFDVDPTFDLPDNVQLSELSQELPGADALICFGGDGTILHASKAAAKYGLPILGVNIGTVGFMAELESSEISLLSKLATDDFILDERMMLSVQVFREGKCVYVDTALNDAVITKGAVARVIQASVKCDGTEALNFSGDGVIIATPTGSTAYSMSAGGPIVEPAAHSIVITPICAHETNSRGIIVSADRKIEISAGRIARRNAILSVDGGKAFRVFSGDVIRISQAPVKTNLLKLKNNSFFDIVKMKLNK